MKKNIQEKAEYNKRWHLLLITALFQISICAAQSRELKGRVLDAASGEALAGVHILIKGSSAGTATDAHGGFVLQAEGNETLVFSFIGYKSFETSLSVGQTFLEVKLEEEVQSLQEVVVVGYGEQKKEHLTGAVVAANMENLAKIPTGDAINALQGQVAGVTVSTPTGAPGAAPVVQIRGYSTMNGTSPLYVIDGIPSDASYLAPNEIESLTVLKDASAATIYGSRGANGVIVITTKKGKAGKSQLAVNSFVGFNEANLNGIKPTRTAQRNLIWRDANNNSGQPPPAWAMDDAKYADTNWADAYFKTGVEQRHDISASGGTDKVNYVYTGGFYSNSGTIINTGFNRYNSRLSLDFKDLLNDRLKLSAGFSFVRKDIKNFSDVSGGGNAGFSPLMYLYTVYPHKAIYDTTSSNGYAGALADLGIGGAGNPIGEQSLKVNDSQNDYLQMNLGADFKILKWLSYQFKLGFNSENLFTNLFYPQYNFGAGATIETPRSWETRGRTNSVVFNNLLNFAKEINGHDIKVLLGQSSEQNAYRSVTGSNLLLASGSVKALDAATGTQGSSGTILENRLLSFFGRVTYSYSNKYFLEASIRRDGSSRFGPNNKYGTFYGVSCGWAVHKEAFFDSKFISELKPRFSYGAVGNQQIDDFQYQSLVTTGGNILNYPFGSTQSISPGAASLGIGVTDIKWEQNSMINAGLDLGIAENKWFIAFDYFQSKTAGMLVPRNVPGSSGIANAPTTNAGNFENRGLEIGISYRKENGQFKHTLNANMGTSKNKVTQLGYEGQQFIDGYVEYQNYPTTRTAVGTSVGEFYLKEADGIFKTQDEIDRYKNREGNLMQPNARPGDLKFADVNRDGYLDDKDKRSFGSGLPKVTFGFNYNGSWKNLDIAIMFNGTIGNKMYNAFKMDLYRLNASPDLVNSWSPANPSSGIPRLVFSDPNSNYTTSSSYFLEDASYLRLRNLQIGYNLPADVLGKTGIAKARIYVGGYNLFTLTKYNGFDPGLTNYGKFARGVDRGYYPINRSYVLGISLSL